MKLKLPLLLFILLCASASYGQGTNSPNARRIYSGTAVPTQTCSPGPSYTDVYIRTTTGVHYTCTAAPNTWTADSVIPTAITVANEATDTTTFPLFVTAVTGDLGPKTNSSFTFNSNTGALGATSFTGSLAGGTGLPISTGVSGLGTGIATALGVNVGSAGAPVVNGGALGSPSSAGTIPAFTLGGTIAGGGNQLNNIIIGTTTPLAGTFTTGVFGSTTSLLLGTAGSAVGNIGFRNATSGTATLAPPAGALGTYSVTLPNAASTLPIFGQQITFAGPTAARTVTFPDAAFTAARTDAAQTFTFADSTNMIFQGGGSGAKLKFNTNGGAPFQFGGLALSAAADSTIRWTATNNNADLSADVTISRAGVGVIRIGGASADSTGTLQSKAITTDTNCADSAGAAACGSATAGAFVIDAASTSTVVSTTSVTANSQIFVQEDSSLGTRLSVTCNTQSSLTLGALRVTARTAATSFTVTLEVGPTTNPMCINYWIVN